MSFDQDQPGYVAPDFLETLRKANLRRCVEGFKHDLDSWSVAEWANAMQGEFGESVGAFLLLFTAKHGGEAGNIAKKMLRFRDGVAGNAPGKTRAEYAREFAKEIAGMVIYADLTLASEGLSLKDAIRDEFNSKSAQLGIDITV